jgi:hypothetical protein
MESYHHLNHNLNYTLTNSRNKYSSLIKRAIINKCLIIKRNQQMSYH